MFALVFRAGEFRNLSAVNQKFSDTGRCLRVKTQKARNERLSKFTDQIAHLYFQGFGNLHQRIHRGRFFTALNPADENGRKTGFFRQFFLAEAGFFALGTNRFTQKAAMGQAGRHGLLKKQESENPAMSLTTILLATQRSGKVN
jgi:hypothetical protein